MIPNSVYSPISFIGRDKELRLVELMLHPDSNAVNAGRILLVRGEGGIGKTQLLNRLATIAATHGEESDHTVLVTRQPIDLSLTQNRTEQGILKNLADQLAPEHFAPFYSLLKGDRASSKSDKIQRDEFLRLYHQLKCDHIVLLFDTLERASEAVLHFLKETLCELKQGKSSQSSPIIILASRRLLQAPLSELEDIEEICLQGLSPPEIAQYFRESRVAVSDTFVEHIARLSSGRPILVALTIDWLSYGNLPADIQASWTEATFERAMIERVGELRYPEDQVILAMAHFNRRFNAGFLQKILNEESETAKALIKSISRFSFVKTWRANGEIIDCQLHDEMNRLVTDYVWSKYDPIRELRRDWSLEAAEYYEQLIADEQDDLNKRSLEREKLYYLLYNGIEAGLDYWRHLLAKAPSLSEKEAINEEVRGFEKRLADREKLELRLREKLELRFQEARVLYEKKYYRRAIEIFESILTTPNLDISLEGELRPYLIYAYTNLGELPKSLLTGSKTEAWFKQKLEEITPNHSKYSELRRFYGCTLNSLGYTYRTQGNTQKAIEYYEESIELLKEIPDSDICLASTKTNLAYLLHLKGKTREALGHGMSALRIGERLEKFSQLEQNYNVVAILSQLGRTHNVMGTIKANSLDEQSAVNHFQAAINYFEKSESERGLALVKVAYGRMQRQVGWYKVQPDREKFEAAKTNYEKAREMLDHAISLLSQQGNQTILIEAYNEKGTLLREQGQYEEALAFFKKSEKTARETSSDICVADNLQDIGLTYYLLGDYNQSLKFSKSAAKIARKSQSPHILGRAQRTVASIWFKRGRHDSAIKLAVQSCLNITRIDEHSSGNSAAKKEKLLSEWLYWIVEDLIAKLPSPEHQQRVCQDLVNYWESRNIDGELDGEPLATNYPGLVILLEDFKNGLARQELATA